MDVNAEAWLGRWSELMVSQSVSQPGQILTTSLGHKTAHASLERSTT